MDPLDTMKAMNELWGKGMQNFFSAQQSAFGAMAPSVGETSIASMSAGRPGLRVRSSGLCRDLDIRPGYFSRACEGAQDDRGTGHRSDDVGHSDQDLRSERLAFGDERGR